MTNKARASGNAEWKAQASHGGIHGDYYDWTATRQPEQPYLHAYERTLVTKMFLAEPDGKGGSNVKLNFEQALARIAAMDALTRGMPKIVYLVGWQYDGHDDRYPAWDEVNAALKSDRHATALESMRWLMAEALRYRTTVSVHINMTDAYTNSPLWHEYADNDLIARNEDGTYVEIGAYNGRPAYQVNYAREWEAGFARRRIDRIIELLALERAGTVHLDAFFPRASPYHGISLETETSAMRKLYRYWRSRGIDVTSEQFARFRSDPFIGLQPMAWWNDLDAVTQFRAPASLACGGMPFEPNDAELGFAFGQSMQGEALFGLEDPEDFEARFVREFCLTTLQSVYLSGFGKLSYEDGIAAYEDGLKVDARRRTVVHRGRPLREGDDVLLPAGWLPHKELIAFSGGGCFGKQWTLPPDWNGAKQVNVLRITAAGLVPLVTGLPVADGTVRLTLQAGQAVAVQAAE